MEKSNSYNQILQQASFKYKMNTIFLCRAWGVESGHFTPTFFFSCLLAVLKKLEREKLIFGLQMPCQDSPELVWAQVEPESSQKVPISVL